MYQGADSRVLSECKKIKTAIYAIFELLHMVEVLAKKAGSVSNFIDSNLIEQQSEEATGLYGLMAERLNPPIKESAWWIKLKRDLWIKEAVPKVVSA